MGETRVICTASAQESVPRWLAGSGRGWVTAEYGMLPASTGERKQRDASRGRPDGRTVEIQRLIGRSLRGVIDFDALGERTVYLDCDVLQADGGTRCAAITGAYVALAEACQRLTREGRLERTPLTGSVAAVSCGVIRGEAMLDVIQEGPYACGWLKSKADVLEGAAAEMTLDIRTLRKDIMSALATGALSGVPMPLSAGVLASLSAAVASDYGGADLAELPKFFREKLLQNFDR